MAESSIWKRINWTGTLFLTLTPLASIIFVPLFIYYYGFSWWQMAVLGIFYVIFNMSITCGYHRLFSHRSYDVHPFLEFFFAFFGAGAFQNSILIWATDHRRHHLKVDTEEDPYSIKKGFWYAHFGWMLLKDPYQDKYPYPKDLLNNKIVMNQHKYYVLWAILSGVILPSFVGYIVGIGWLGGLLFGWLLRVVLTQHSTFFVNSIAHTFGSQPYSNTHTAKDSFIVAVLTFGEGYHNYHHEFQSDYRSAVRWYQWDPSKWTIRVMWLLGLVKRLKKFSDEEIMLAKIRLQSERLTVQGKWNDKLNTLKNRLEEAQKRYKHLKLEYQKIKNNKAIEYKTKIETFKTEIQLARKELNTIYRQFWVYTKSLEAH